MEKNVESRRWFDLKAAGEYLMISPKAVGNATRDGRLPRARIGGKIVVERAALDRWALSETERAEH